MTDTTNLYAENNLLLGAIAGDLIGSYYEFRPTKDLNFPLFHPESRFTDDTVMTMATAQWILTQDNLPSLMQEYGKKTDKCHCSCTYHITGKNSVCVSWSLNSLDQLH